MAEQTNQPAVHTATHAATLGAEPQSVHQTDVAIIGSGPGGYACALRAAQLGLHVTLIERDEHAGGTCLNRGCIPTKALLDAAHAVRDARRGAELGFGTQTTTPDRAKLLDFQHDAVHTMVSGLESLIQARRIDFVHGTAEITSAAAATDAAIKDASVTDAAADPHAAAAPSHTLTITSPAEGTRTISARHVVVATGASPRALSAVPFGGHVLDSDAALELPEIPRSVIVIGSGAIGLEFASFWATMGSKVTVLLRHGKPLSSWPRRVGSALKRGMTAHGVTFLDYTSVESFAEAGDSHDATGAVRLTLATKKGTTTLAADYALVAIGRTPATSAAWIAQVGIVLDDHGFIATDPLGRTTVPGIWAVGDVTAGRQLAHRAFAQGRVVAEAIAGLSPAPVQDVLVPRVVFSFPEAASVGLDADQAKSGAFGTFHDVKESAISMDGNARTAIAGETGVVDVVTGVPDEATDDATGVAATSSGTPRLVLGVHMVGPHVSEFTGEAQQIIRNRIPLHEAADAIHAHPTFSEAFGEALLKADGSPLHTL